MRKKGLGVTLRCWPQPLERWRHEMEQLGEGGVLRSSVLGILNLRYCVLDIHLEVSSRQLDVRVGGSGLNLGIIGAHTAFKTMGLGVVVHGLGVDGTERKEGPGLGPGVPPAGGQSVKECQGRLGKSRSVILHFKHL